MNVEDYLQSWHTRHPDAGAAFRNARDAEGRSSFDRLADLVQPGAAVLDMACGSAILCELLACSRSPAAVFGVDLTLPELEHARIRAPRAHYVRGRTQALPFRDESFDAVLCHMALMLFDDVDTVLQEARRVMRAGGTFAAVTNAATGLSEPGERIVSAVRARWHLSDPAMRAPRLGDLRTRGAENLCTLVSAYFADVVVQPFTTTQLVSRADLWTYLASASYDFEAIPDGEAAALLAELTLPDPVPWTLPFLLVQGTRDR